MERISSGDDLLARLAAGLRPDLLILAFSTEGAALCRRVRAQDDAAALTVLMLTPRDVPAAVAASLAAGAHDVLPVPCEDAELLARIAVLGRLRGQLEGLGNVARERPADTDASQKAEELLARQVRHSKLVAAVGHVMTRVADKRQALQACAETLVEHLDAAFARIWLVDGAGRDLLLHASAGLYTHLNGAHGRVPIGKFKIGLIAQERQPHLTNHVVGDERVGDQAWARREGMVAFAGYPLLVADRLLGVVALFARAPLASDTLDALQQVADLLAFGIERLDAETERRRLHAEVDASRQRLQSLVTNAPAFVATLRGPEHVFEMVNPPYQRLVGAGRQLLGARVQDALPEVVPQGFIALLDKAYRTGEAFTGDEVPIQLDRRGDGQSESVFLNFVYSPARDGAGQVAGIDVFGFEVTEQVQGRQRAEALAEKLRDSEDRLRRVVEASGIGTWDMDAKTHEVIADERYRALFGLKPDEPLTYDKVLSSIHPEDRARVRRAVADAVAGKDGGNYLAEYRSSQRPGWIETRGHVSYGPDGAIVRLLGTGVDVTGRKNAELDLRTRIDFEQQLIGIVSHDLRNPLSVISMSAGTLLRRADLDERLTRPLGRILSSAERAARMIRDLLDFTQSRLGGALPIEPAEMDLHAISRQIVDELQVSHPDRVLELNQEGAGKGVWDQDRLAQVLGNLLSNALHYSAPGTPVGVHTHAEGDVMVLEVHNLGNPISAAVLPKLFQPMQRGVTTADKQSRSVGLGLYIVDQIVRAHKGTIDVTSTETEGTTFRVRLPRRVEASTTKPSSEIQVS